LSRHKDVELLLEEYARQLSNILFEINFLLQRLQSKQEFVSIALASYRNRLIRMNLYLAVAGITLGIGTTVAGYFGMNVINGYESSPVAFNAIILGTSVTGLAVAAVCASYVSGKTMQARAFRRMDEIQTLTSALSDMAALDYTVKKALNEGVPMSREEFGKTLKLARHSGRVTDEELDLLFDIMDNQRDGVIQTDDLPEYQKSKRTTGTSNR
jgi:magnesium transporter